MNWQLYIIIDSSAIGNRDSRELTQAVLRGGADVIQLRDKEGPSDKLIAQTRQLLPLTKKMGVPLIINDHPDLAEHAGADGVHVGQDDPSIHEIRQRIKRPSFIVGKSTHSRSQALAAVNEGADYIGFGPIFSTPTKPTYAPLGTSDIQEVHARIQIPIVCIGGIDTHTVKTVAKAGARCIAVVRAVCQSQDPELAARTLKSALQQNACFFPP